MVEKVDVLLQVNRCVPVFFVEIYHEVPWAKDELVRCSVWNSALTFWIVHHVGVSNHLLCNGEPLLVCKHRDINAVFEFGCYLTAILAFRGAAV